MSLIRDCGEKCNCKNCGRWTLTYIIKLKKRKKK